MPEELWLGEIMPYFSLKELSLGGTIAKHFQKYWVTFKSKRKLCVPKDFPSLSEAVRVGQILSRRGIGGRSRNSRTSRAFTEFRRSV